MTIRHIASLSLVTILLSSCSMIPDYQKPQVETPARWTMDATDAAGQQIPTQWWTVFNDTTLNQLIADAGRKNLDLKAGLERVEQSRANLKIAGASLLPSADASLSASKTRTNPTTGSNATTNALGGGLSIAYELDLFGANSATREAAKATLKSAELTQKALELTTYGDVAEAYFNLLLTRERIRIGEENLKNSSELLRIVEARVKAGVDSNLELSQQKVAVANSEAALSSLKQSETVYRNALSVLLGRTPDMFNLPSAALDKIAVPAIAAGQPSTLLERRPDIASMEQTLIASNANIGVARAAFFPSITLGLTASAAGTGLTDPFGTALGITSALAAPIFEGGRIEGGVEKATAEQRELAANYQKTVLTAFGETENALSAVKTSSDRETSLKEAVAEAQKAYDISRKRYDVGTIDFATLLDTQSALLAAQDAAAQASKSRLSASLDLIKALGGGWKEGDLNAAPVAAPVAAATEATTPALAAAPTATTTPAKATQQAEQKPVKKVKKSVKKSVKKTTPTAEAQTTPVAAATSAAGTAVTSETQKALTAQTATPAATPAATETAAPIAAPSAAPAIDASLAPVAAPSAAAPVAAPVAEQIVVPTAPASASAPEVHDTLPVPTGTVQVPTQTPVPVPTPTPAPASK